MSKIKKPEIKEYLDTESNSINTFRTLILFGKNVATYKFALCHALLNQKAKNEISYEDLRDDFLKELISHYRINDHQFSKKENTLTKAIDAYLQTDQSGSDWNDLLKVAEKNIYNNVFDAFQNVGGGTIDNQYILFEHDKKSKRLVLTDNINELLEDEKAKEVIRAENQLRWSVVEEAWRSGLSPNLLEYNEDEGTFYSIDRDRRVALRSAVDVLMPYQKGRCFYCNRHLNKEAGSQDDDFPDVDHFLPRSTLSILNPQGVNIDGVWNLVMACKYCNRGKDGKFDEKPDVEYFYKLKKRNVLFVEEHKHSLKNSILLSLDVQNKQGVEIKMNKMHESFRAFRGWKPKIIFPIEN